MDIIGVLEWLGEQGIDALVRADGERFAEGSTKPWTFAASGGLLADRPVRIDARSAEKCLLTAAPILEGRGIPLPIELIVASGQRFVMNGTFRWIPREDGGRDRPFVGGTYIPNAYLEPGTVDALWSIRFDDLPAGLGDCEAEASWLVWEGRPPIVAPGERLTVTEGSRPVATFDVRTVRVVG